MPQSSKSSPPRKPHRDFPLFAHQAGQWAKKVRGRTHYFGVWAHPQAALEKWLAEKDALLAGKDPRGASHDGNTLRDLANAFLEHKQALVVNGELKPRTFSEYYQACKGLIKQLGKHQILDGIRPEDFTAYRAVLAKRLGLTALCNEIQRVRSVFKFAYDSGMLEAPIRFGPGFERPKKKTLRIARAKKGIQMFECDELRRILHAANAQMKAMILLGINCGFGNSDCGTLPLAAIDLERGWVNYHRPKTGINRRCPLWPETVEALREAIKNRPAPKDPSHAGLAFITVWGGSWYKQTEDNPISKEMRKLLDRLGINGQRNFYVLRHTHETIAGESRDQVAVNAIMGHVDNTMSGTYRERISDERLLAVSERVRAWLFGGQA
jgi:integrase